MLNKEDAILLWLSEINILKSYRELYNCELSCMVIGLF